MSTPKLIDIHAHVNFNAFKEDSDAVVRRTLAENVWMIMPGSQIDTSRRAVEFAQKYQSGVYAAVGLHPIHLVDVYIDRSEVGNPAGTPNFSSRKEEFDFEAYKTLAENKKTVAIGEFGLDYFRPLEPAEKETTGQKIVLTEKIKKKQEEVMRAQIRLARAVKKPVMIHCRPSAGTQDAYDDSLRILKEEEANEVGGDIHFFVGNWETAKKFLDFGFYLSFTGVITFARQYDEVIKNSPLDRIMVETDSPYVAPALHRGRRNEPLYVEEIAERIAEIKGLSYDTVAASTVENTLRLFKLTL